MSSTIRILPDHLVNQIAAGEVIERPAAALKEIMENALDAGAQHLDITLAQGGKALIIVRDDGVGMTDQDLRLAVTRHATSKLPTDDLVHINTMGFRGEALPSIGAVARLSITSRTKAATTAWSMRVEGGQITVAEPAAHPPGTTIQVRDLFFATPARLKFLKADVTEYSACKDMIIRLGLARPDVGFTLTHNDQRIFHWPSNQADPDPLAARMRLVLGADFEQNTVPLHAADHDLTLTGRMAVPTFNRGQATHQFLFVNNRPVKDRLLLGALRAAYHDVIPHDRHAVALLMLHLPPEDVDMNVHPAKAEVRFRDVQRIRGFLIAAMRARLATIPGANQARADHFITRLAATATTAEPQSYLNHPPAPFAPPAALYDAARTPYQPLLGTSWPSLRPSPAPSDMPPNPDYPLGIARAQIHNTYIIAQTHDGVVLVDQHAAHERLVYERYKKDLAATGIKAQRLLTPDMIPMDDVRTGLLLQHADMLATYGLEIEGFGPDCVLVRAVPAELAERLDLPRVMNDLADEVLSRGTAEGLSERLLHFLATKACHHAVRAGRPLNGDEMNALLRQIEATPLAAQCNHGRPTFIKLSLNDLERLFERR